MPSANLTPASGRQGHATLRSAKPLTSSMRTRGVYAGDDMADISQYSIVTYERRPGYWRAAITPHAHSGLFIRGKTTTSFVTPEDFESEPDAQFAAEKII